MDEFDDLLVMIIVVFLVGIFWRLWFVVCPSVVVGCCCRCCLSAVAVVAVGERMCGGVEELGITCGGGGGCWRGRLGARVFFGTGADDGDEVAVCVVGGGR